MKERCRSRTFTLQGSFATKLGRKMSKSLGNSPDPLELIDKYGADGVRMGMMLAGSPPETIFFSTTRSANRDVTSAARYGTPSV